MQKIIASTKASCVRVQNRVQKAPGASKPSASEYADTDENPVNREPSPVHVRAVTHQHQHHRSTDEECHGERPGELRQDFAAIPMILAHPQQKANGAGRKIHCDDSPKQFHFTDAAIFSAASLKIMTGCTSKSTMSLQLAIH